MAIGVGGSLVGGLFGSSGASAQRAWEQQMMNTYYQRTSADMMKAGLNPLMMYMKGGGPVGGIPTPPNIKESIGEGVGTAAKQAAIDIPMAQSTMAKQAADAVNSLTQSEVNKATRDKVMQDALVSMSQNQVNLARLGQIAQETGLTADQRRQIGVAIQELQARIALEKSQQLLTTNSARVKGTEATALDVLVPFLNSAKAGMDRLMGPKPLPREAGDDIRPQSYINRTRGQASSAGQGVTPGGANSAMKAMLDSTLARQEP